MEIYSFALKHDTGIFTNCVLGDNLLDAITKILTAELAPEKTIISLKISKTYKNKKIMTTTTKKIVLTDLHKALMHNEDITREAADQMISEFYDRVADGENPEEILYDEGLEPDYVLDILFYK